jgi:hypothetical protein
MAWRVRCHASSHVGWRTAADASAREAEPWVDPFEQSRGVERATGLEPATLSFGIDMIKDQPELLVCRSDQAMSVEDPTIAGVRRPQPAHKVGTLYKAEVADDCGEERGVDHQSGHAHAARWDETVEVVVEVSMGSWSSRGHELFRLLAASLPSSSLWAKTGGSGSRAPGRFPPIGQRPCDGGHKMLHARLPHGTQPLERRCRHQNEYAT